MARIKLTAGRIADFGTDKTQAFLWDTETPGLAVRATPSGVKAFIFQAKLNGQAIRITIGDVRAWSIDKARVQATAYQNLIDQGRDPREVKRETTAADVAKRAEHRRLGVTVAAAWEIYLEARRAKWSERHYRNHLMLSTAGGKKLTRGRRPNGPDTTQPGSIYPLLWLRLSELDADKVKEWLASEVKKRPTQAESAFRKLRTFLAWCAEQPDYQQSAHAEICETKAIREMVPKVKPKDDVLQREQLHPWYEAVKRIGNPVISAYLQGLLLTGARREELAAVKWGDVDFQWKSLTLHDKVEGERTIPLTPYLANLLTALPRRNEWVFSSLSAASGRIQEPRIQHVKALAAASLPHVSLHGLRRSFGTLSEWVEVPTGVVAQIMGHKPSAIAEKHYRRRPLDLLRMWHTRIESWMLEQAGIDYSREHRT